MDRISVKVIQAPQDSSRMMPFLARLTQRGHTIKTMDDLMDLYSSNASDALIEKLASMPHGTIKRFNTYAVAIVGASRRFLAQIRTHQLANFVSASLQYSDWSKDEDPGRLFTVPYEIIDKPDLREYYLNCCKRAFIQYSTIADAVGNDAAGFVLPNGFRNILIMEANAQEWQYVIGLRTCRRNSSETRYVVYRIWEELLKTPNGEQFFSIPSSGCGCQKGQCLEGHMSCGDPLPKTSPPTELIKKEFPLLNTEE